MRDTRFRALHYGRHCSIALGGVQCRPVTGSCMSTNSADAAVDRQRQRAARKQKSGADAKRPTGPPRQRRPALAALALLLIVGGALLAGVLALRMDSREAVLVAATDIAPGTQITADMLVEAQVASDKLQTIDVDQASQVVGTYATTTIAKDSLVEVSALSNEAPVSGDRAVVAVGLNPALTPAGLKPGDLVEVVRVSGNSSGGGSSNSATTLSEGLVLAITKQGGDDLGGTQAASVNLLVPSSVAGDIIDASAGDLAGLALLERGRDTDVELEDSK